ncbi:carboxypeptidase-like regulatory domain-containing protein [Dyella sp. 2HG41-7]|uniref:carboxypeptidase-like regulatory domain-containing protein n=1 Tax=Dyella sp. 2HG41-7 TaxID=2883239 RepID=UPI001F186FCE|nr:carboxypeptidase-like regulatory domain-containing protein [Dyella sp. 2HG41-7]
MFKIEHFKARKHLYFGALSLLVAASSVVTSLSPATVRAQDTSATIFGHAPAGETVTASSATGSHHHKMVNSDGRYKFGSLPPGDYTVTLEKDGQTVDTRSNIPLIVGHNAEIDFACPNDKCAAK